MNIKKILDRSGVSVTEFAMLVGVSRNMAYKWLKGSSPHPLRLPKVEKVLATLDAAANSGELPLEEVGIPRIKRIQTIVLANLKRGV